MRSCAAKVRAFGWEARFRGENARFQSDRARDGARPARCGGESARVDARLDSGSQAFLEQIRSDPTRYGSVEAQCERYAEVALAYADAYVATSSRSMRTVSGGIAKRLAAAALREASAALAKIINATASVADTDRSDLGLAITAPARPSRKPGTPDNFTIALSPIGLLMLKWKCANPQRGVMYIVSRSVAGGAFEYLGITGERRFTDESIPAGATEIRYRVQAVRLKQVGHAVMFDVNFGLNGRKLPPTTQLRQAA